MTKRLPTAIGIKNRVLDIRLSVSVLCVATVAIYYAVKSLNSNTELDVKQVIDSLADTLTDYIKNVDVENEEEKSIIDRLKDGLIESIKQYIKERLKSIDTDQKYSIL